MNGWRTEHKEYCDLFVNAGCLAVKCSERKKDLSDRLYEISMGQADTHLTSSAV